ncbi:hypothetical protein [Mycoplasmopsis arginini]|uniref:hypothetical protein n=1 Tax=Mycoplasmopsis arginini TaxID=2094 RepID=UPI002734E684|nr:hypothetical protein [Mycoplasmopsis arginini]MDP4042888.1 hypothetical protein [Mycoplasmopsis arginini]
MKKTIYALLPILSILPLVTMSAKISDNEFKNEEEKQRAYAIYDYIKLTGRQDAQIIKTFKLKSKIPAIPTGKMFWFNDKGYSVISDYDNYIYEVNPDIKLSSFDYKLVQGLELLAPRKICRTF